MPVNLIITDKSNYKNTINMHCEILYHMDIDNGYAT